MRRSCLVLGAMSGIMTFTLVLTPPEADDKDHVLAGNGNVTSGRDRGGPYTTPCQTNADGCSIPHWALPIFEADMIRVMTPSCNNHDMCYHCGLRYRVTRAQCDRTFLQEMHGACRRLTASQLSVRRPLQESVRVCHNTARVFYLSVAFFASSSYVGSASKVPAFCPSVTHCIASI